MGILDSLVGKKDRLNIEEIKSRSYQQKYGNACRFIWKKYVPKCGQAACLQGELLREIEKIRCEAQDNGNINWDDDYSYFCDFIRESMAGQAMFSKIEKEEIYLIMSYLKECGEYAQKFREGKIPEHSIDIEKIAYVNDNLYDMICDKIGKLQEAHSKPIVYKHLEHIRR